MRGDVPEADWKKFRNLRETALERFCERILSELRYLSSEPDNSAHERYLAVYKRLHERDEEVARAFNGASRSQMLMQLFNMRALELVTDDELAQFSQETRQRIESWMTFRREGG